jgi:hypothetical protein
MWTTLREKVTESGGELWAPGVYTSVLTRLGLCAQPYTHHSRGGTASLGVEWRS